MAQATEEAEQSSAVSNTTSELFSSWLSFDGEKGVSSHEFVQKVQRTAFQHGKQRDDEWIADFAATSFCGKALDWYIGLDEEVQTSWRSLRAALTQRWPVDSPNQSSPQADMNPANIPAPAPATTPPYSLLPAVDNVPLGIIDVRDKHGQSLGYVSLDAEGRCIIQKEAARALVIGRPQQVLSAAPCRIAIEGPEDTKKSLSHMPYLGLSLFRQLGRNPDFVPEIIPYQTQGNKIYAGEPLPSSFCKPTTKLNGMYLLATWYISPCPKDPPGPWRKRTSLEPAIPAAAAFAWVLDSVSSELIATWLMEDGTLYDLAAYVDDRYSRDPILHMHRRRDIYVLQENKPSGLIWDDRVRLYFKSI